MSFSLSQAKICVNCDWIFGQNISYCLKCGSEQVYPLSKWLNRKEDMKLILKRHEELKIKNKEERNNGRN